jgi:hypothetical protein
MTSPGDDWTRWAHAWQEQPAADIEWLERRVRRKRRRMQLMVMLECLVTCIVVVQVALLQARPDVPLRWKVWGVVALVLALSLEYVLLRVRRGTWRAARGGVAELLRLTAKRAHAGIRLAWVNIVGLVLLPVVSLPFALPYLAPARWRHDPALQHMLVLNAAVNGIVVLVFLVVYGLYIRRQRRLLRRIETLARELSDTEPDQDDA